MNEVISLEGPLESQDGRLVLLLPRESGGNELIECSKGDFRN